MTRYGMLIDLNTCAGCASCVMACKQVNATPSGIYWCNVSMKEEGAYPNAKKKVLPAGCMHCAQAPCVANCPTGASYRTDEGLILVDQEKCIGCRTCEKVCPYEARHYNSEESGAPYWGSEFGATPYESAKTSQMHETGKMGKCTFCFDRLVEGKEPICVQTCITKCRTFGDLDDPDSEVSRAIAESGAKPLQEELGTEPSVYYLGTY